MVHFVTKDMKNWSLNDIGAEDTMILPYDMNCVTARRKRNLGIHCRLPACRYNRLVRRHLYRASHQSRRSPDPMISPQVWSVYERTLMGRDRTNNFVETTHRRMHAEFGVDHPTLWKFINSTRAVQPGRDHYADLYFRGEEPPRRRRKDIRSDERVRRLVGQFGSRTPIDYLRAISYNFTAH
uniref:Uncharacterized protein n=1 Tax=Trichuris muris TaxID=70415 RepID=A0A5S6QBE9_TRIMR